jgi:hypothetical protein
MIKNKLMLVAILGASVILPAAVQAQGISVHIGDQPYYSHGARYWDGNYQMVWIAGHMSNHHWVHGHYVRSQYHRHHGQWNRPAYSQDYRYDGDRRY